MRTPSVKIKYPGSEFITKVLEPVVGPMATKIGQGTLQRMLGFWLMWHLYGGHDALLEAGLRSRTSLWRDRQEFQQVFGCEVQDWQPEVSSALITAAKRAVKS